MAIIYNGTPVSSLKYNEENIDVVWVCDTSTTCCTKVFYPPQRTIAASIICPWNDISSVYCYGATGSFGNTTICGQQLCLYSCPEYFCTYLDTSSSSLCFASLCLDTSDFVGCTLEIETCNVAAYVRATSRCSTGVSCTAALGFPALLDDGNTRSTVISGTTTCVNLIAPVSYVYSCTYCGNWGEYFRNFVNNICYIDTCISNYWLNNVGEWVNACIYVRIKDSADNVILCGTYIPTYSQVVLNS